MQDLDTRSELVIVSNRLPVNRVRRARQIVWESSPGGLVSALRPLLRERECTWIGWHGSSSETIAPFVFDNIGHRPVTISAAELKGYYEGFCNRALWPLYHDAIRQPEYHREWWKHYDAVNRRFASAAAECTAAGGLVWVHDYQLQLVPAMLREMRPDIRIGFFLHVPFPPQELFAQLPWRRELLEGMLGADVVGFQTKVGAANFVQVCKRFCDVGGTGEHIRLQARTVQVGCFPISIDSEYYEHLAASAEVAARREELRAMLGNSRRVLLGLDRLDYTKGIDIRMHAFGELLRSGRARPEQCVLVQVAVPSREHVPEYRQLRLEVERLVGEINGEFGEIGRVPVHYLHRSVSHVELSALYTMAGVMLVTPLRDGMNLVSKEYVASRIDNTGVLVLSEFTGAARELTSALQVNPHDMDGVIDRMHQALNMPVREQTSRMRAMRRVILRHDVFHWAHSFFESLAHAHAT